MEANNEVKGYDKERMHKIVDYVGGGLLIGLAFMLGHKYCSFKTNLGLQKVFEADPELSGRMWDAIGKANGLKP